ncbi:hypothetical protein [Euzebya sp.]|uniref:hypothetical protein n=1 Tax=Euzebya sp. TaxID=1971409 RepID=UPI0035185ED0
MRVALGLPSVTELRPGWIKTAATDGMCHYVLADQPDRVRGPARYLRPASPATAETDDGSGGHIHDRPAPPAANTPCLVVTIGGSFDLDSAWVIPFP